MRAFKVLCLSICALIAPGSVGQASAQFVAATFQDTTGDTPGTEVDISQMELRFSTVSGNYAVIFTATAAKPFTGSFRINVNLFNPDAPAGLQFFQDVINDHPVGVGCTFPGFPFRFADGDRTYILTGQSNLLKSWQVGHRVAASDVPYGNPPGSGGFRTAVGNDQMAPAMSAALLATSVDPVLTLGQGGLEGSYFSGGALFQWLFANNITYATPALVDAARFNQGSINFAQSFNFLKPNGSLEQLGVVAQGVNRGGGLGASSSFSLSGGRPALIQANACGAVVHRLQGFQDFWDGVAYLFLKFTFHGTNTSSGGGQSAGKMIVGTNPFDLKTFTFASGQVNSTQVVPFGLIYANQPINAIFAVVASTLVDNRLGQYPNASASAAFLDTLTLDEVRLTYDAAGQQTIPVDHFISDTGLALRVVNGVGIPLVDPDESTPADLLQNGDFSNGMTNWLEFGTPASSYLESNLTNGVYQFRRVPQPAGQPVSQAVVFQNSGIALPTGRAVTATFDLGNTSSARKYMKVLLVGDAAFSDLAACTFWLPPNAPLRTYQMKSFTTQPWANAAVYFYASSPNTDDGYYQVDKVSLQQSPGGSLTETDCVDPLAPAPPGGPAGPNLVINGDFTSGLLSPWATFGTITLRTPIVGGVLEMLRPTGANPPGVVLNATTQAVTANQILTATFQLGNVSGVRQRALVIIHDNDFSDLVACNFWLSPGQALTDYTMTFYASKAWTNATFAVYPRTIGDVPWLRLDNATLSQTPGAATPGTACRELGTPPPPLPPALVTRSR